MAITALPTPPSRSAPSTFSTLADAFIAAFPVFVTEANAQAAALELNDTTDASVSSVAIGLGAKTFTVTAAKSFQPGMWLVIADDAAPSTNAMYGTVTSYATDQLVMSIKSLIGTGTKSAWTISQSAPMNLLTALTTAINTAYATVASHATTSAIWAAAGNIINFTGAETITDFPAADQAGSQRFLICAAACVFTHAGSITVQGGATRTAVAGDVVIVTATAVDAFKVSFIAQTETGTGSTVRATTPTITTPKIDTINEATGANGVVVDGVTLKDGGINISGALAASGQIAFPATAVPSADPNTLDDYEEGTWTPVPADAVSGGNTGSAGLANGQYTKIGRVVHITSMILQDIDTTGLTAGNHFYIQGLPFTVNGPYNEGSVQASFITFTEYLTCNPSSEVNSISLHESASGANLDYTIVSEVATGTADIRLNVTYVI